MAPRNAPSFVRDPDQAAELAALLRDQADALSDEYGERQYQLSRAQRAQAVQTIARYRRWSDELDPPAEDEPAQAPVHIRPARDYPQAASDA